MNSLELGVYSNSGAIITQTSEGPILIETSKTLMSRVEAMVRESDYYRWLTAHPKPDFIEIHLRKTHHQTVR
jgi:hypothetical protein